MLCFSRLLGRKCLNVSRIRYIAAIPVPHSEAEETKGKDYPQHIVDIVEQISKLTLIETAELNELLKVRRNCSLDRICSCWKKIYINMCGVPEFPPRGNSHNIWFLEFNNVGFCEFWSLFTNCKQEIGKARKMHELLGAIAESAARHVSAIKTVRRRHYLHTYHFS